MAAVLAFVAFVAFLLALVFHIIGGSVAKHWIDAELIGLMFVSLTLIALALGWHGLRRGSPS
jgi:di/tricarboxylate transporter